MPRKMLHQNSIRMSGVMAFRVKPVDGKTKKTIFVGAENFMCMRVPPCLSMEIVGRGTKNSNL